MVLPGFFPIVAKGCEEVSEEFFQCLDSKSEPWGQKEAAKKGLESCKTELAKYEKCYQSVKNSK